MDSIYAPKHINDILPFEVLSYSFTFVDPCDPQNAHFATTLSLICQTWRRIVLDTPAVWTCIRIQTRNKPLTKDTIEASKAWYQRSKQLGCHFYLEFPLRVGEETSDSIVSELIQPIAPRLETLFLCVPAAFLGDFTFVTPFQFPRLRSFTIRFPRDDHSRLLPLKFLPSTGLFHSSSLHRLELTHGRVIGFFQDPKTSFRWSTLTHLNLHDKGLRAYDSLDIFCLATNLVHCELTIPGWPAHALDPNFVGSTVSVSGNSDPYRPPCIHLHLRVLKLAFSSGVVSPFFARLSLPKLEDFRLSAQNILDPTYVHDALLDLAARHPIEGLKRFEVEGISCPGDTMIEFLKKNEEIETLKLDDCDLCDEEFLGKLIIVPETPEGGTISPYAYAALSSAFSSSSQAVVSSYFLQNAASSIVPKLKYIWLNGTPDEDEWQLMETSPSSLLYFSEQKRGRSPKDETIQAFVESRSPAEGGTLKKVVMDNYMIEKEEVLEELIKLREGGMVLDLVGLGTSNRSRESSDEDDWWVA